ncbi:ion-transporting P-type ATPase [Blattamonas nauphoetae]|uniref:Ion-transporting P-type ATPase n=1 Tax=Blattamonas nauphoetae TaxID=2049346 RepID=A0ABQ9XC58_9EUKA|nr:ion-transporting P-type ATPase [Blattamonas nauphoetae]
MTSSDNTPLLQNQDQGRYSSSNWPEKEKLAEIMEERDAKLLEQFDGVVGLMNQLNSSPQGLSSDPKGIAERQERYGKNEMAKPKTKSFFKIWLESLNDATLILLIVLAVISLVIALAVEKGKDLSWLDGTAILATVLVVTIVSSVNTFSQERQFQKLNNQQKDRTILIMRDNKPTQTSIYQLVVGDIFMIQTGDVLPADGLCIEASNLACDEAPMTGESDLMKKDPEVKPFLLCGCKVQTGFGKMLVTNVGMDTQFGILKQAVLTASSERTLTPLQQKLNKLSKQIGYIGFIAAGLTLVLLIIFWVIPGLKDKPRWKKPSHYLLLVDYFIMAVSIIVMAVPEGLPLAVTIALAYSMKKMLKDNNLVRVLSSCETMGGATTICSDKTGTLTQNRMKVAAGFFDGKLIMNIPTASDHRAPVETKTYQAAPAAPSASINAEGNEGLVSQTTRVASTENSPLSVLSEDYMTLLYEAMAMNSTANLKKEDNGTVTYLGNVTECAMLLFSQEQGIDYNAIRESHTIAQAFPFSSEKKRMTVIVQKENGIRVFTKGASEIVSKLCTKMHKDGEIVAIGDEERKNIEETIHKLASNGLRTIAISYRDIPSKDVPEHSNPAILFPEENPPEEDLILIGITGIKDPLRPEVPSAIEDCHDAHIVVRMVTGDNIVTAMHIAEECGIYNPKEGVAIEGPLFRALSEEDRLRLIPKLQVMARSSPIDKHTLVSGLQQLGHVVAVTGDGTNDAPALSKSDVGFAMGIAGTEVAKDAAAIIITDDNFASIVKAVMWGRNVYDNIRKFLQFQLTVNFSALTVAVIGAVFAIAPLKAVQMLWVNLIMDTFAALALATEIPTKQLLKRRPYGKTDSLICPSMWRNILVGTIFQVICLVLMLFLWGKAAPWKVDPADPAFDRTKDCSLLTARDEIDCSEIFFPKGLCRHFALEPKIAVFSKEHFSFIFNTFIYLQVFNLLPSRKCYNEINFFTQITRNIPFLVILGLIAGLQVCIMLIPGLRDAFSIIPPTPLLWGFTFAFSLCILPVQFVARLIKTPDPFHGEIEIVSDAGVPAGVYEFGKPAPAGCQLTIPMPKDKSTDASILHDNEHLDPSLVVRTSGKKRWIKLSHSVKATSQFKRVRGGVGPVKKDIEIGFLLPESQ